MSAHDTTPAGAMGDRVFSPAEDSDGHDDRDSDGDTTIIGVETAQYLDVSTVPIFVPGDQTDSDTTSVHSAVRRQSFEDLQVYLDRGRSETGAGGEEGEEGETMPNGKGEMEQHEGGTTKQKEAQSTDDDSVGRFPAESSPSVPLAEGQTDHDVEGSSSGVEEELDVSDLDHHNANARWHDNMLQRTWVSAGNHSIYSPEKGRMVSMPAHRTERTKAVIDLYLYLTKQAWFVHLSDDDGRWIAYTITADVWTKTFTVDESKQLQKATRKNIVYDLKTRAITLVEEWRLVYGFPKVPATAKEIGEAVTEMAAVERRRRKLEFLNDESSRLKVDRWVRFLFRNLVDGDRLGTFLNHGNGVRLLLVEKMMVVTELPFVDGIEWSVRALPKANHGDSWFIC